MNDKDADIDEMMRKFENCSNNMISNIIGLPLLACRIAQNAALIKDNPDIRTEAECTAFIIDDLTSYSKKLKNEDCLGYMFIDKYIDNLKRAAKDKS